jgi:hypothetical protein
VALHQVSVYLVEQGREGQSFDREMAMHGATIDAQVPRHLLGGTASARKQGHYQFAARCAEALAAPQLCR